MNGEQEFVADRKLKLVHRREAAKDVNPKKVFQELVELLEDYGPTWYTEATHDRAVAALAALNGAMPTTERRPTSA